MANTVLQTRRELAQRVFAAHTGAGPAVEGYGASGWRQWLITGVGGTWFAVPKADPTSKPRAFPCALADAKAILLSGR
jgi:hypothetical protein